MQKAPHILNTSANLAGICFLVFTALNGLNLNEKSILDEMTALAMLLFVSSSLLSFMSMRSDGAKSSQYERWADYIFFTGLLLLLALTLIITIAEGMRIRWR
ncbi:MAG: hypothetical protein JSR44_16440 [Spirochaetes bacterium]|nr:hypothetical protein [Spirochaetota bacterium]